MITGGVERRERKQEGTGVNCVVNKANLVQNLFLVYLSISTCGMQGGMSFIPPCIPDSHPYRITSTKCRKNRVVSPDDGHTVPETCRN